MKKEIRSNCPIGLSLDIFGDRWTLLIMRDLLMRNRKRYQDFLNASEGISTNILAQRLTYLEEMGLTTKTPDPHNKKQFNYIPTAKALDLLPVLCEVIRWGLKHHPDAQSNPVVDKMLKDETNFKKDIRVQFQ
jgi:DNA-binding HxlR family transcriptional regulator